LWFDGKELVYIYNLKYDVTDPNFLKSSQRGRKEMLSGDGEKRFVFFFAAWSRGGRGGE
jgi:hypothetical protein